MSVFFPGLLRLLACPGPPHPHGRDWRDHPEDPLAEEQRRGGKGLRQAKVGGGAAGGPPAAVRSEGWTRPEPEARNCDTGFEEAKARSQ